MLKLILKESRASVIFENLLAVKMPPMCCLQRNNANYRALKVKGVKEGALLKYSREARGLREDAFSTS